MSCHLCGSVVIGGECQYCGTGSNPEPKTAVTSSDVISIVGLAMVPIGIQLSVKSKDPYKRAIGNALAGAGTGAIIAWVIGNTSKVKRKVMI